MSRFERLLKAATPTEFFILFFHFVSEREALTLDLGVTPVEYQGESALELTVPQNVVYPRPNGERLFRKEITHVLILTQAGEIIWEMKGQAPLVGLEAIQARLRALQSALEQQDAAGV